MDPIEDPAAAADVALLVRVAAMDADAFELLYDRHAAAAHALAYRIVGSRPAADDVSQEAFLAVWRSASRFDPRRGTPRSWILTIVRNRAIDHLRRETRVHERETLDDERTARHPAPAAEGTESTVIRRATDGETRGLLDELSPDQRRVIELAFYSGYTHSEIAGMLELPLGTVKARMNRGLARMRRAVTATGGAS